VADHPLRPATDRRLGRPLPYQLANRTSAHPIARGPCRSPALLSRDHAVLAQVSLGYPPRQGKFRCITHPSATLLGVAPFRVRLACVRHAASVQSEPGSNSSVQNKLVELKAILEKLASFFERFLAGLGIQDTSEAGKDPIPSNPPEDRSSSARRQPFVSNRSAPESRASYFRFPRCQAIRSIFFHPVHPAPTRPPTMHRLPPSPSDRSAAGSRKL
jgi:hypothetical protein